MANKTEDKLIWILVNIQDYVKHNLDEAKDADKKVWGEQNHAFERGKQEAYENILALINNLSRSL